MCQQCTGWAMPLITTTNTLSVNGSSGPVTIASVDSKYCPSGLVLKPTAYSSRQHIACTLPEGHLWGLSMNHVGMIAAQDGGIWGKGIQPVFWRENDNIPFGVCGDRFEDAVCAQEYSHHGHHTQAGAGPMNPYAMSSLTWHYANGRMRSSGSVQPLRRPRTRAERTGRRH